MAAFRGFPAEAIEFLQELEANNDRDWFKANRARYEQFLLSPATALGEDLSDFGAPRLFRPFNDTRFRPGPPIKEHIGLAIGYEGAGGFYVELSLDGLLVAAGLHNPAPDQVERLRQALDQPRLAARLRKAIAGAQTAGLQLGEPDLSRGPRGYRADHPQMDLLRRRKITLSASHKLAGWLHRPSAGTRIQEQLRAATPVVRWLREQLGPSTTVPGREKRRDASMVSRGLW
ncbi:MAG TPA: DUF2461 domain-containing protein [Solirubrobacteraceae bacterium]